MMMNIHVYNNTNYRREVGEHILNRAFDLGCYKELNISLSSSIVEQNKTLMVSGSNFSKSGEVEYQLFFDGGEYYPESVYASKEGDILIEVITDCSTPISEFEIQISDIESGKSTSVIFTVIASLACDETPPELVSSTPSNMATDVLVNINDVCFQFNEAMSPQSSIKWIGVAENTISTTGTWNSPETICFSVNDSFPFFTTIYWTLNDPASTDFFTDLAGNKLPFTEGYFITEYDPDDIDNDGDGFTENQDDCNDTDATIYPNAPELCDGIDNQCPGDPGHDVVDEGCGSGEAICFSNFQVIPTIGAIDWESFKINGDTYLAVSNRQSGTTFNIDSKIYKWNGMSFGEFQAISTNSAMDFESFEINGEAYLAVANYYNGSTRNVDSKIFKWNGASFAEMQSIPTSGASDWESFTIDGESYLAVANFFNDTTFNIDSIIYKWNGASFVEFQGIPTNGAIDWESFTINGATYLAIANRQNDTTHNIDSIIYKWNGASFVEYQSIPTNGAQHWESFMIDGETYLAVANRFNDSTHYIDSKIFKWNGASFAEIQSITTSGAMDWDSFNIGEDIYLAVANSNFYSAGTPNIDSKFYRWDGMSFIEMQSIPTVGALDWESFTIDSELYLAVANYYDFSINSNNIDSIIYKASENCLDSGLIVHYPLDGNANDVVGGNHGTVNGGVGYAAGVMGQAASFDGIDGYIEVPDSSVLDLTYTFSISAWIKTASIGTIVSKMSWCPDGSNPFKGSSYSMEARGTSFLRVEKGGNVQYLAGQIQGDKTIEDDQFHLITLTFNNGQTKVFVDGNLDTSGLFEIDTNDPSAEFYTTSGGSCVGYKKEPVSIGWCGFPEINYSGVLNVDQAYVGSEALRIGSNWSYCNWVNEPYLNFDGLIDDLRIYNRALTETEIQTLYSLNN